MPVVAAAAVRDRSAGRRARERRRARRSRPAPTTIACRTAGVPPTPRPATSASSTGTSRHPDRRPARGPDPGGDELLPSAIRSAGGRKHIPTATRRRGPTLTPGLGQQPAPEAGRDRDRDAGAVAGGVVGGPRAAVGEGGERLERERHGPAGVAAVAGSATNPTPQASCSCAGVVEGASIGSRRWAMASVRRDSCVVSILSGAAPGVGGGTVPIRRASERDRAGSGRNRIAIVDSAGTVEGRCIPITTSRTTRPCVCPGGPAAWRTAPERRRHRRIGPGLIGAAPSPRRRGAACLFPFQRRGPAA